MTIKDEYKIELDVIQEWNDKDNNPICFYCRNKLDSFEFYLDHKHCLRLACIEKTYCCISCHRCGGKHKHNRKTCKPINFSESLDEWF